MSEGGREGREREGGKEEKDVAKRRGWGWDLGTLKALKHGEERQNDKRKKK